MAGGGSAAAEAARRAAAAERDQRIIAAYSEAWSTTAELLKLGFPPARGLTDIVTGIFAKHAIDVVQVTLDLMRGESVGSIVIKFGVEFAIDAAVGSAVAFITGTTGGTALVLGGIAAGTLQLMGVQSATGELAVYLITDFGPKFVAYLRGKDPDSILREVDRNNSDYLLQVHIKKYGGSNAPFLENPQCFEGETPILLENGSSKPIRDIRVGDLVTSYNEAGEVCVRRVTELFRGTTFEFVELEDGTRVTPNHRYLTSTGEFKSISEIITNSELVVAADGSYRHINGHAINAADEAAGTYKIAVGQLSAVRVSIEPWDTYNFAVEDTHTYIAGGLRVHNACALPGDQIEYEILTPTARYLVGHTAAGSSLIITEHRDLTTGKLTLVQREYTFATSDAIVTRQWSEFATDGTPVGEGELEVVYPNAVITAGEIGEIFGSTLGSALAGKNQFAQIAAGSVLGAVLQNVGQALDFYFRETPVVEGGGAPSFEEALRGSFSNFGKDLFNQIKSQGIGAISGYLAAELGEAIGVGGGFGGQLFETIGSKSIGYILGNVVNNLQAGDPIFQGLTTNGFLTNLEIGIGSFLGSYLGRQVITPETQAGAIGGSIGSALGAAIGSGLLGSGILASAPVIGGLLSGVGGLFGAVLNIALPGIGAFIGVILGTLIGDLFGSKKKPKANADATLYFADGHFYAGYSSRKHDGNIEFARAMNERTRTLVNGYIDLIGGLNSNSVSPIIRTGHSEEDVYAKVWNQDTGTWETKYGTADEVTEWAVFKAMKLVDIQGGDIYLKRAVNNSTATNLRDFVGDLKIAEDYRTYIENKSVIDAIIASDPHSVFAAGWIVTLVRAEELGITKWQKTDFNGGLKGFLHSMGLETLGGSYEMTRISLGEDRLLIDIRDKDGRVLRSIEVDEAVSRLGFTFVTGSAGTTGRDVWLALPAGGSFTDAAGTLRLEGSDDILIGNSGADTINAGIGWDYVQGQGGNDTINAGAGNDQVYGGDGDDTIYGDNVADASQITWSNGQAWIKIAGVSFHVQGYDVDQAGADVLGGAGRVWFGVDFLTPSVPADGYGSIRTPFGDDELHGGQGNDTIEGLSGSDRIHGDAGNDILRGGSGDDLIEGGAGADTIDGGIGLDTASYATASAGVTVNLLAGTSSDGDTLSNVEDVVGSKFADTIIGSDGANMFDGGDGADVIDGNGGTDTISYRSAKSGLVIDLAGGTGTITVKNPTAGQPDIVTTDSLSEIESVIGSDFDDTIIGSASSGKLVGGKGNDTFKIQGDGVTGPQMEVVGGEGFDTLDFSGRTSAVTVDLDYANTGNKYYSIEKVIGGDGNDKIKAYEESQVIVAGKGNDDLQGGAGDDVYVFNRGDGSDTVKDFGLTWTAGYGNQKTSSWIASSVGNVEYGGVDFLSFGAGVDFRHIVGQLSTETTGANIASTLGLGGTPGSPNFTNADFVLALKDDSTLYQSNVNGLQDQIHVRMGGELAQTYSWVTYGTTTYNWIEIRREGNESIEEIPRSNTYSYGVDIKIDADAGAIEWLTFEDSGAIELKDVRRFVTGTAGADSNLVSASTTSGGTTTVHSSWIFAGAGADTVNGGAQNDIIIGDKDNDILNGGAGDDQYGYWLGDGTDIIYDSAGQDALIFGGGIASTDVRLVRGGLANATDANSFAADANGADLKIEVYNKAGQLTGSLIIRNYLTQANTIEEFRFSDTVKSLAEFTKTLSGTDFDDVLNGTSGDDTINALAGNDKIDAGDGDDILIGGAGADALNGGLGKDFVSYATAAAAIVVNMTTAAEGQTGFGNNHGTASTKDYIGDTYANIEGIIGSSFNDDITGDASANDLRGGAGNDTIRGGDGDDIIIGGLGADTLRGNAGIDTLSYEDYDSSLQLTISGGGLSVAKYTDGTGALVNLGDNVAEFERFRGGTKADTITGDAAANYVEGMAGADTINGLGGIDTVSYESSAKGVSVNLALATAQAATFGSDTNGDAAGDILTNIENLVGSAKNDELRGTAGDNALSGGAGDDLLFGGGGTDKLDGGNGIDTAEFAGVASDYDIIQRGLNFEVHKKTDAAAVVTTLTNIEKLKFGSTVIDLATDKPTIAGATISVQMGGSGSGKLAAVDGQASPGNLVFSIDGAAPVNGTFALNADGTYIYAPARDFRGSETIRVRVTDATGLSTIAEVTLKSVGEGWTGGSETRVNTTTGYSQTESTIIALNDGGYYVIWTDEGAYTGSSYVTNPRASGIFGQRFDAQGQPVGGQTAISAVSTYDRQRASAASLPDGGFILTWSVQVDGGWSYTDPIQKIFARRFDAQGQPVGSEFLVSPTTSYTRDNPKAVAFADGSFMIIWEANSEDGSGYGIYAQRFTAAGVASGTQFRLNATTSGDQRDISAVLLNDGSVMVFWSSNGQDGNGFGIYGRRFNSSGTALGGEVLINTATAGHQNYPSVTKLADGSLIVAWASATGVNILARKLAADGTPLGSEFQLNSGVNQAYSQTDVEIKALPDGSFIAVWRSDDQDSNNAGVIARYFLADGRPAGDEFIVTTTVYGHQWMPAVTVLSDGRVSFVWQSADGSDYGIYNRIFTMGAPDIYTGGSSDDVLIGNTGDDLFLGEGGGDKISGGSGSDTVSYKNANAAVTVGLDAPAGSGATTDAPARTGDAAGDIFDSIENLEGSRLNDVLVGNSGANVLTGLAGNDILRGLGGSDRLVGGSGSDLLEGGAGADVLIGGESFDIASYAQSSAAVSIDLAAGTASGGEAQGDTLTTIEGVIGSAFNDTLSGNDDGNLLDGGAGNDTLQGRGGDDDLFGGDGDDTLTGGTGADVLDGGNGSDTASYQSSAAGVTVNLATGTGSGGDAQGDTLSGIETVLGSEQADSLTGDALANTLAGGGGNDTLDGGDGNDNLRGGNGADILTGGAGIDQIDYINSTSGVSINLATGAASGGEAAGDTFSGIEDIRGSHQNDTLVGDSNANSIYGGSGDDVLDGGDGNDLLAGWAGADSLVGGDGIDTADYSVAWGAVTVNLGTGTASGSDAEGDTFSSIENLQGSGYGDTLTGSDGDNAITGLGGDDILKGGDGNDTIAGNAGADDLDGGNGIDWLDYTSSGAGVSVSLAAGTGSGGDAQGDMLQNFENIRGSSYADTLTGSAGINVLEGNAGDDVLEGGADGDWLYGGIGLDTASYQNSAVGVTVDLSIAAGVAQLSTGDASGDRLYDIENVTGSAFDDILTGSNRILDGNGLIVSSGNNILKGGAGADTISGGSGDDQLFGEDGADTLSGDDGDDTLNGGVGADSLTGGAGSDTADYSGSTLGVTLSLQTGTGTGGDAEGDQLSGIENLAGSANDDMLTGDDLANIISGAAGNDILDGGDGNDTLIGGAGADQFIGGNGIDTVSYQTSGSGITVHLGNLALNTGDSQGDTFTGIEILRGSLFNDTLIGSSGNDIIAGGLGADKLDGGDGVDTLDYGASLTGVSINLKSKFASGDEAQGDTFSNFENVSGSSFSDILIGDDGVNTLTGNAGNDVLGGNGGVDVLSGGDGDDTLSGDAGGDTLDGGQGVDILDYSGSDAAVTINLATSTVSGGHAQGDIISSFENILGSAHNDDLTGDSGNNILVGGAGNDVLAGDAANDTLAGGTGNDTLTGGSGDDIYRFAKGDGADLIAESGLAGDNDQLVFASDIKSDDLWFRQDGNNLVISVLGTDDSVTVQDWFTGSGNEVEEIRAGDGKVLDHSEVQLLINAMSGFQPSSATHPFGIKPEDQLPQQVATVYASTWQLST